MAYFFPPRKLFKLGNTCSVGLGSGKTPAKNYLFGPFVCLCARVWICVCVCVCNKCGCVKQFRVKFPCVLRSQPHIIHSFIHSCVFVMASHYTLVWKIFRIYLLIFIYACVGVLIAQPMAVLYSIYISMFI